MEPQACQNVEGVVVVSSWFVAENVGSFRLVGSIVVELAKGKEEYCDRLCIEKRRFNSIVLD